MKPEFLNKTQRMLQRAREVGTGAVTGVLDAPDDAAKRRRLVILIGGTVLVVAVGLFVFSHWPKPGDSAAPISQALTVSAIQVAEHNFEGAISITGEARPVRDIHVFAPASGVRVLELLADEGDRVRAGQPLARLDTALATAQIRAAEANVAAAESSAIRARGEYERAESIRDSGALSTEAIEQRRAAATAADAQLAAARAQLQETQARLQGGYVRAPLAGLIISRSVQLGALVDSQEMFRIAGGNEIEIAANIAEADVIALSQNQTATFRLVDGTSIEARISRLPASIDTRTRTGEALFALPRNTPVRAGMHLSGEVRRTPHSGLAVPQASVLYDNGQAFVFTIKTEGERSIAQKAVVELGERDGDLVEVRSGLDAGARVIGSGAAFVQDGDEIRPVDQQRQTAPQQSGANDLRGRSNG